MGKTGPWGILLLRVMLGVIYVMHGYLGLVVIGPAGLAAYAIRMGLPPGLAPLLAWYHIAAHLGGGVLLLLGLWTRWAALAQVPSMASAVFLLHWKPGFFMSAGGGYEFALLVLVATVTLILTGGGALAADGK
jgi:putative oxidoreductase